MDFIWNNLALRKYGIYTPVHATVSPQSPVSQYGLMQAQYSSTGRERSYMYGVKRFERFLIMSSILKFLCTSFRVQ